MLNRVGNSRKPIVRNYLKSESVFFFFFLRSNSNRNRNRRSEICKSKSKKSIIERQKIGNRKSGIHNLKTEIRNRKSESVKNPRSGICKSKSKKSIMNLKIEIGNRKSGIDNRNRESERALYFVAFGVPIQTYLIGFVLRASVATFCECYHLIHRPFLSKDKWDNGQLLWKGKLEETQ